MDAKLRTKQDLQNEDLLERLKKSYEDCKTRIKTCENYVSDKMEDTKNYVKDVDLKFATLATKEHIDKLAEANKLIKANF